MKATRRVSILHPAAAAMRVKPADLARDLKEGHCVMPSEEAVRRGTGLFEEYMRGEEQSDAHTD